MINEDTLTKKAKEFANYNFSEYVYKVIAIAEYSYAEGFKEALRQVQSESLTKQS